MTAPNATDEQLAAWEALCEAATKGRWSHRTKLDDGTPWSDIVCDEPDGDWLVITDSDYLRDEDAAFIVQARTAMPALIAALREAQGREEHLTSELAAVQEKMERWRSAAFRAEAAEKREAELRAEVERLTREREEAGEAMREAAADVAEGAATDVRALRSYDATDRTLKETVARLVSRVADRIRALPTTPPPAAKDAP